ncbi:ATP-grasp domain-containing protein [Actinomyces slackii]|uniref:Alanine-anticapsin ligase BacD n=2 Tax=Actinomyces slackii TaxID=52774 RepID=A0A448KFI0_9ACTO|nr:ATP-grasp domain-containing protein [Actinomyces slackii]VEG75704.1 Alanine-anticapsin ligase BacD [Actinomyces slackii]
MTRPTPPAPSSQTPGEGGTAAAPTVLILGASRLQVPMIRRAREMGMRTIAVDLDPTAPGAELADEFHVVSTNDIPGVVELARSKRVDGVTTVGTDMPVRSIAAAAEQLGLVGPSTRTARICTDKAEMAQAFAEAGLPHPRFETVSSLEQAEQAVASIGLPCILKPLDSSGSRGVIQLDDASGLPAAFDYAASSSRSGQILVEELLVGPEISCEALAVDGHCHLLAITDKATTGAPHFIETGHTQPAPLEAATKQAVRDLVARTLTAMGVTDGPAHVEIILTATGPRLVELGARMAGDFVSSHLVPLSTGVDFIGLVLAQACGLAIEPPAPEPRAGAIRFLKARAGTLRAISGVERARALPGVQEVIILAEPGQALTGLHSSLDRLGVIIARGSDHDEAARICQAAHDLITVEVQP